MKKHFNVGYFLLILAVVGGVVAIISPYIAASLEQARQSEVKTTFASIITSLEAYRKEYDQYSDDFKAIGFSPEGDLRYQIYLTANEVPENVKVLLRESELPFVSKDEYRLLAVEKSGNFMRVFVLARGSEIRIRDL